MVLSFVLGPYIIFNSEDGRKIVSDVQEFYIFFIGFLVAFPFPVNVQQQFISEWVIYLSIFAIFQRRIEQGDDVFRRDLRLDVVDGSQDEAASGG